MTDGTYHGGREEYPFNYTDFRTPRYLTGPANKIIHDFEKVARLYNGKKVHVFRPSEDTERCPDCTDLITGEQIYKNCDKCGGSGYVEGYDKISEQWAYLDIAQEHRVATGVGTTDNPGGIRHQLVFIGEPLLKDQDLIVTEDTKIVYKLIEVAPQIVAMAGSVITQMGQVSKITPGQKEYDIVHRAYEELEKTDSWDPDDSGYFTAYEGGKTFTNTLQFQLPEDTIEWEIEIEMSSESKLKIFTENDDTLVEEDSEIGPNYNKTWDSYELSEPENIYIELDENVVLNEYNITVKVDV